ncbi:hypothetical protein KKA27_00130 [Patescibacteria group bacterium]|nr:hypothetical protein [Patescibacteria group bacterium]MBU2633088.1 hypothetical protein [Patescibacteria group bacterium]
MKEKYSRGELAKEILKGLALGGFIAVCFVAPNLAQVIKMFETKDWKDRDRLKKSLSGLQRQKLIKVSYNKKMEEIIEVTEKGRTKILKYKFDDLKITPPKKWDKMWRLVAFDMPEKKKKARDSLTVKLQEIGFYPLQKSVFIYPYACGDEIDFICGFFGIKEFVHYFVIKEAEDTSELKKKFNLK